jgi:hypothetical protein
VLLRWLALGDGRRITLTGACAFSATPPRAGDRPQVRLDEPVGGVADR